jgi:hypothetical protein
MKSSLLFGFINQKVATANQLAKSRHSIPDVRLVCILPLVDPQNKTSYDIS